MIHILHRPMAIVSLLVLALAVSGCGRLPAGAPIERDILETADDPYPGLAVYPVTRAFLPAYAEWPAVGEAHLRWLPRHVTPPARRIAPGDTLDITVFDGSENPLLGAPGTRSVNLAGVRVSETGHVFVPYLGRVRVAGQSLDRARSVIQDGLTELIASPQVQVSLTEGRGNTVDLVSGVSAPGPYPMPDRSFTVLSLIAAGGGVAPGLENPQIRLIRGGTRYGTSIGRLYDEPALDSTLRGGDRVIVEADDRYFVALGAAGTEDRIPFPKDAVTAIDALAEMAGLDEGRADPGGVLILREYPASALGAGVRGPRETRVAFTIDLTEADGLFSARQFRVMPGDLILATESPVVRARTIAGLIGSGFGLLGQAASAGG